MAPTTTIRTRESAKIYQFPAGGRDALRAEGHDMPVDEFAAASMSRVVSCGSWYHEEAIRDADPVTGKH